MTRADQLKAGDVLAQGTIDNVSIEHTEGGAQQRSSEGELVTVFAFSGNQVTVEFISGEFASFWESDEVTVR